MSFRTFTAWQKHLKRRQALEVTAQLRQRNEEKWQEFKSNDQPTPI